MQARLVTLIVGSSLSATGLGALLPYLYTDIARTRGLGGGIAVLGAWFLYRAIET